MKSTSPTLRVAWSGAHILVRALFVVALLALVAVGLYVLVSVVVALIASGFAG